MKAFTIYEVMIVIAIASILTVVFLGNRVGAERPPREEITRDIYRIMINGHPYLLYRGYGICPETQD